LDHKSKGLEEVRIKVEGAKEKQLFLNGVKSAHVEMEFSGSIWKALGSGYDIEVNVTDGGGSYQAGETHLDGALEGLLGFLLVLFVFLLMFIIALLGAAIVPIIMVACAVAIAVSIAVIVAKWDDWKTNMRDTVTSEGEKLANGGVPNGVAIAAAIFDLTMVLAFSTLILAVSILFLCLKPYTSLGGWVIDQAIDKASKMIIAAFVLAAASEFISGLEGKAPGAETIKTYLSDKVSKVGLGLASIGAFLIALEIKMGWCVDVIASLILALGGFFVVFLGAGLSSEAQIFTILVGFAMSVWGLLSALKGLSKSRDNSQKIFYGASSIVSVIGAVINLNEYRKWAQENEP